MKNRKERPGMILVSLFELIVGTLLLIRPVRFTAGIITAGGIVLMAEAALDLAILIASSFVKTEDKT